MGPHGHPAGAEACNRPNGHTSPLPVFPHRPARVIDQADRRRSSELCDENKQEGNGRKEAEGHENLAYHTTIHSGLGCQSRYTINPGIRRDDAQGVAHETPQSKCALRLHVVKSDQRPVFVNSFHVPESSSGTEAATSPPSSARPGESIMRPGSR